MQGVLLGFFLIAVIIVVGFIGAKTKIVDHTSERVLNRVAFNIATPALLFGVISQADLSVLLSDALIIQFITIAICLIITVIVLKAFSGLSLGPIALAAGSTVWVNANNIGLPMSIYVLGDGSYVASTILYQILIFSPVLLFILDMATKGKTSVLGIMTQPFKNPITIGSALGLVVAITQIELPDFVTMPFEILGTAAIPLMLLSFGIGIGTAKLPGSEPEKFRGFWFVVLMKLIGFPLVSYLLGAFVYGLEGIQLLALVLISSLPSAQNIYNFSSQYQIFTGTTRTIVLYTTLGSLPVILGFAAFVS